MTATGCFKNVGQSLHPSSSTGFSRELSLISPAQALCQEWDSVATSMAGMNRAKAGQSRPPVQPSSASCKDRRTKFPDGPQADMTLTSQYCSAPLSPPVPALLGRDKPLSAAHDKGTLSPPRALTKERDVGCLPILMLLLLLLLVPRLLRLLADVDGQPRPHHPAGRRTHESQFELAKNRSLTSPVPCSPSPLTGASVPKAGQRLIFRHN